EMVGATPIDTAEDAAADRPPRLYLSRYGHATADRSGPSLPGRKPKPAIALVTVAGAIVSGRGRPQPSPLGRSNAGADTIAAALRDAAANDDVAAIVLRVDSPGGSYVASDAIWRQVALAREAGKPVVASMGAVAASGGYYISAVADAIVANPGTITGSIGVLTGKLIARDLKERLGVGTDSVKTNANADAWSVNAPFTAEQHAQVEAEADLLYTDFVARVAQGRQLSVDAVEKVAGGRVWTGVDALAHGLVDELGGLHTAVRRAKILAGLDPDADTRTVSYPGSSLLELLRPRPSSQPIAASLPDAVGALLVGSLIGVVDQVERSLTGAQVLWLGESRL
ncbi:MAG TPA: signal peptide peptidase SppA, partial [Mycobacterium sp.]|nr:signal peptide peptidase SppA [Mycobacterium sp.]